MLLSYILIFITAYYKNTEGSEVVLKWECM